MSDSPPVKPPFLNLYISVYCFPCPHPCVFLIEIWNTFHNALAVLTEHTEDITLFNAAPVNLYLITFILFNHFSMYLSEISLDPSGTS